MGRDAVRILLPLALLCLGCPGERLELDARKAEVAPPTLSTQELAALEVGLPAFCSDGVAVLEFTEPGQRFVLAFDLRAGETVRLETTGDQTLDTVVHLFAPGEGGLPVATDDDSGPGRLSVLETVAKSDGRHRAMLTTYGGVGRGVTTLSIHVGGQAGCRDAPPVVPADLQGPTELDLGKVAVGTSIEAQLVLRNPGGTDAIVDRVAFEAVGATGLSWNWPCARTAGDAQAFLPIGPAAGDTTAVCAGTVTVPAGGSLAVPVRYQADAAGAVRATLTFHSTDPEDLVVTLLVNREGPCLMAVPSQVNFGVVAIGFAQTRQVEVRSCALEADTHVTAIDLQDPVGPFALELVSMDSSTDEPMVLAPGDAWHLTVSFLRTQPLTTRDSNTLLVHSDDPSSPLRIELIAFAGTPTPPVCDFAIVAEGITVPDGGEVEPLKQLQFADRSYDTMDGGAITSRQWSLAAPEGSPQVFKPSTGMANVSFKPLLAGEYVFSLEVENAAGQTATCQQTVNVTWPEGWHIVLTWTTPGDPDQTDECGPEVHCGADLDLHVVHPFAAGDVLDPNGQPYGYFDVPYDVYWNNAHPMWESSNPDPALQPRLDRDDTGGAGPEMFTWNRPTANRCVRVGVHYFDDHSFGLSYPTVQIWDSGELVHTKTLVSGLRLLEMWDVGKVCDTEEGTEIVIHTTVAGSPVVIKNYKSPF